jgi:hypothetical protein
MLQNIGINEVFDYMLQKFKSAKYKIDTYHLFLEQSLITLLKPQAMGGFIVPNTFLKNIHAEPLRKLILDNAIIKEIRLFNYSVFASTSVDTSIIILEKGKATNKNKLIVSVSNDILSVNQIAKIKQSAFSNNSRLNFELLISENDAAVLEKITKNSSPLGDYCNAYFGIQTFDRSLYVSKTKKNKRYEPVIDGYNIEPYNLKPANEFVHYIPSAIKSGGNEIIYRQNRICIRQIGVVPIASFVPANIFTLNTIYNIYPKTDNKINLKFLLGIINANITKFFWKKKFYDNKKTFPKIKKEAILSIPIPIINNNNTQNDIVRLVDQLLKLNAEKSETKLPSKINQLNEKITYCEDKINQIIYQLYGLTKEEIAVAEEAGGEQ